MGTYPENMCSNFQKKSIKTVGGVELLYKLLTNRLMKSHDNRPLANVPKTNNHIEAIEGFTKMHTNSERRRQG